MVDVWLPSGKTEVCARIPTRNFLGAIEPKEKQGIQNPTEEIKRALNNPLGTEKLSKMARPDSKVVIIVDDVTRRAPSNLMVPPILEELNAAGVKDENITVMFACGTHRAVKIEEALTLLGEEVVRKVRTVSHDCNAPDHVYVGTTKTHGTKVYIDKVVADADVRILTGDVCLHYYAGYGGGRKSILPGVSSAETIQHNHAMLLHPKAKTGNLDGNPVHEDMVEAARLAKVDFILNVVTNAKGEVVKAFAGDLEQAFYEGVKLVDEMYKVTVDRRCDIAIVSSAGYPSDINLFQAYKAVDNALDIVKRGGAVILVAECTEGHGNQVFYDWMVKYKTVEELEREIKRHFVLGGHKAYYLRKAQQKVSMILVSVMPDYYAANVFGFKTAKAVNEALDMAFNIVGRDAKIWAMPQGNLTLPVLKTE